LQNAIKADDALINAAELPLGYTRLTSPIDGITGIRLVDVGNIVSPALPRRRRQARSVTRKSPYNSN
jgi:multidrug efflux system membrane fusion protein